MKANLSIALPLLLAPTQFGRPVAQEADVARTAIAASPSDTGQVYDVRELLDALPPSFALASPPPQSRATAATEWLPGKYQVERGRAQWSIAPLSGLGYLGEAKPDDARTQRTAKCAALTRLVRGFIQPPLVDGRDQLAGYAEPGILLLKAPPEGHAWLSRFLALRQQAPRMFEVKLWAIDAPAGQLERLGVGHDGRATLAADALEGFLDRASKGGANLVLAPQLVMFECAVSSLSVIDDFNYVKEFRFVTVQPGNQTIADPVIETLPEGWSVELLAAEIAAGEFGVDLYARQQIVQRPVRTQDVPLGSDHSGTVSTPVGLTHELRTRFAFPLEVLPYTGDAWQDAPAPAQVFRLTTSLRDRELAVVVRVRARVSKPAEPPAVPVGSTPPAQR